VYDGWIADGPHSAFAFKYRLTRDDGAELDVPGSLWEAVLERAYLNGWRPSGTGAPGEAEVKTARLATIVDAQSPGRRRWPEADYFSASSQRVYAADALEFASAVLHGLPPRTGATVPSDPRKEASMSRIASFARIGGFVIGRASARAQSPESDPG